MTKPLPKAWLKAPGDRWATAHILMSNLGDWYSTAECSCGWRSGRLDHHYSPYQHLGVDLNPAIISGKAHRKRMFRPGMRFRRWLYQGLYQFLDRYSHGFYRSFDCKGGHHTACETCGCRCHDIKMY